GVRQAGGALGWVGLLFVLAAAARLAGGTLRRSDISVACALALALGVLLACTVSRWDDGLWESYHVLLLAWSLIGLAVVVAGWVVTDRALAAQADNLDKNEGIYPAIALVRGWGAAIGAAVAGLAVRGGFEDPTGPWWATRGLLAGFVLTGAVAGWTPRPGVGLHRGPLA